ncbi:LysR family transcriptional regulator [Vibrio albus]|nr:LysR family transcriptional regulator [Vibrio albus]
MIDVKYLNTFHRVTVLKNFSAAADSLYISQPAVSQHIKKLEERIGAAVFERSGGVSLTREGEILFSFTKKNLDLFEQFFNELHHHSPREHYKLAVSSLVCPHLTDKLVNTLNDLFQLGVVICSFENELEINVNDYDLVLGMLNATDKSGQLVKVRDSRYKIILHQEDSVSPECVIFSKSLTRETAQRLLMQSGIITDKVLVWSGSASSDLMRYKLDQPHTVVICPGWSVSSEYYHRLSTIESINCYGWCSEHFSRELKKHGGGDHLSDLLVHLQIGDVQFEPVN